MQSGPHQRSWEILAFFPDPFRDNLEYSAVAGPCSPAAALSNRICDADGFCVRLCRSVTDPSFSFRILGGGVGIVERRDVPAVTLLSVGFNTVRIEGPALGGIVVASLALWRLSP
ncbi:MAG: hypothetical protein E5Y65_07755 [Mesorhizobium sp.]|nr:hypothetical protein EOA88_08285 [Mesorhizobium sp. M5C.F.Ca.IN.020.14.1.1]RWE99201.1 MAG: hypothetical protein EOS43_16080 [Mesorhizobium sp.]RWL14755.1 MAG: hypothetical protein EOR57_31860 [Mesorhizobium sp.]TIL92983.1 MAG: hypothetical protein E5Y65_07755 [Mesorhizobium sp.]TIM01296.1 MAG: hypothetical protein E5Y64_10495 [Mesorhizobium sp.]